MDILTDTWENERKLMDLSTAEPEDYTFQQDDLCFVGIPVFEGRVPKLVVSRLKTLVSNGAQAVAVAVYGGRAVDDALLELTDVLTETGFRCGAAIEAVAEHSILAHLCPEPPRCPGYSGSAPVCRKNPGTV